MSGHRRHVVYPAVGTVLLVLGLLGSEGFQAATAQSATSTSSTETPTVQWQLVLDGERTDWPDAVEKAPLDSLRAMGLRLLRHLRREGHYYATLDSVTVDTSEVPATAHLHVHRGRQVRIGELRINGDSAVSENELRALMETSEGDPLRPRQLETDIQALLGRYENAGRPLAQIRVAKARLSGTESPHLEVTLRVDEGPELWLKRIEVPDDARTSPELLAHLANLEIGEPLRSYEPSVLRQRLRDEDLFRTVESPTLRIDADGGAVLRVPVEEAAPGAFDFVLGYLPPSRTRDAGQLVGTGHLLLKNVFGGGRVAEFTLDRRPGRTSLFDVALRDPYLLGLPLRVEGQFQGEQRDSTYSERVYRLMAGYRLGEGLELTAALSREVVGPGPAGARLINGRQRIPRSTTVFYGFGVRYQELDRSHNPRRGLSIDLRLSQGQKQRRVRRATPDGDTTRTSDSFRQERLRARVRAYAPLFPRQVIVVGGEGTILLSPEGVQDRSDLFRLGGAASLRGYDEDRFLGNVVARGLAEYRFQFDPGSYAYAFVDLGYVARPALNTGQAVQGVHPGYGLGLRLQTDIGRITTTYALNPDVRSPSNGRVHLGLSVGL